MTVQTLTTDRLILRKPDARDTDAAVTFFQSERACYVGGPFSLGGAWRHFASEIGHWDIRGYGLWAVVRKSTPDATAIGLVGAWYPADWPEFEIGWLIFDAANQGQGFAFEAARAALGHAFTDLRQPTVVSYIDAENTASIALAERLGATLDATARQPKPEKPCLIYRHPVPATDVRTTA
ncbi:GNAT family N-acetyltransferase [Shimia abyssi]|uniref:RimJ/RimL family protein N-acetyltransferase n=1 Tax=Shimia abyssi TaxID=1662395 RepID=A0A2P8FKQ8_9RHOB|nr:GNAT family N-acetyltransferase [Shimia abyssi]PSL22288.1 RimJ/RimL family protein N-acetyltransferase [Shimia abyssi]